MFDNDGKRPGDFFLTMDAAAIDFGLFYNDNSIRENREYGAFIYRVTNQKGDIGYSYNFATVGREFRLIEENTVAVFIPKEPQARELLNEIETKAIKT